MTRSADHGGLNRRAAYASISVAAMLLAMKAYAVITTGSTAMLGSLADTGLDLIASLATLLGVWIGAQPAEGSRIPGIRKWPEAYLPKIYDPAQVDELVLVSQADAEDMARRLARQEGLFVGISAAGAAWAALQLAQQVQDATIVFIVCDRGERYLSTGVFPA
jgi:threonine synthase